MSEYKYDEAYEIVAAMAKAKMLMNAHKGHVEDIPLDKLQGFIASEAKELKSAIDMDDYVNIIEEAADIFNYTIGMVYNAMNNYRNR